MQRPCPWQQQEAAKPRGEQGTHQSSRRSSEVRCWRNTVAAPAPVSTVAKKSVAYSRKLLVCTHPLRQCPRDQREGALLAGDAVRLAARLM